MKTLIRKIIPSNSPLDTFIHNIYKFRFWHPKPWKDNLLEDYAQYKKKVQFIQVGSNNGISGDPINNLILKNDWHGVLVEPVPYLFNELKKNYHNIQNRLIFENSAIADKSGELKFYRLKKSDLPGLPPWYDQLGSFNKEVVLKHKASIPHFDDLLIEDSVKAITFDELLKKHSIKNIDLIEIDTEGYDYEVLKMVPFSEYDIDLIMFENRHLSEEDYKNAIKLLKSNGFIVGTQYKDTIAVNKRILQFIMSDI